MKIEKATEVGNYTKDIPYLVIKLYPDEIRELYKTVLNGGENTNFNQDFLESLTEFLSDYDSGKYDKLTKV